MCIIGGRGVSDGSRGEGGRFGEDNIGFENKDGVNLESFA